MNGYYGFRDNEGRVVMIRVRDVPDGDKAARALENAIGVPVAFSPVK